MDDFLWKKQTCPLQQASALTEAILSMVILALTEIGFFFFFYIFILEPNLQVNILTILQLNTHLYIFNVCKLAYCLQIGATE